MKKKVLVIDDNEITCQFVETFFGKLGCEVEAVCKPFGVVDTILEFRPDVVLLDINLPGLSGRHIAELIRNIDTGKRIKTVLFSVAPEEVQKQFVTDRLADDYCIKGCSFNILSRKVLGIAPSDL